MEKVTISTSQVDVDCEKEEMKGNFMQALKRSVSRKFLKGRTKENDLISATLVNFIVAAELTQDRKLKNKLLSVVRSVLLLI